MWNVDVLRTALFSTFTIVETERSSQGLGTGGEIGATTSVSPSYFVMPLTPEIDSTYLLELSKLWITSKTV